MDWSLIVRIPKIHVLFTDDFAWPLCGKYLRFVQIWKMVSTHKPRSPGQELVNVISVECSQCEVSKLTYRLTHPIAQQYDIRFSNDLMEEHCAHFTEEHKHRTPNSWEGVFIFFSHPNLWVRTAVCTPLRLEISKPGTNRPIRCSHCRQLANTSQVASSDTHTTQDLPKRGHSLPLTNGKTKTGR